MNPSQTVTLYRKAVEYAGLTGRERVLDAYSGVGTVSLFMARAAREVYGIESVRTAVHDARANAELNAITNARFIEGRVERALPALLREGVTFDVAVVDPPRAGCDREALLALAGEAMGSDETRGLGGVPQIVYISCNPSTLARDLAILSGLDYRIVEVQPVDMFPHTHHVETVVLITRVTK
ncbi:MAG: 23S rRNA (uracil-C(5))-methyltransferase RlmCD [Firmicutes bacterium ADurb.BinA052]|nr:MAG: 23S rRNA (uracil-C(5))-methyltransferase RlmCD [Firmicutes bacterium ADurb.BinA052]